MDSTSRNISVMANALSDDPRQAMSTARTIGFAGIVFDAHSRAIDLPSLSTTGRREFAHLLKSNAQSLAAIQADIGPKGFGPGADIERLMAGIDEALHVARDLRAGAVLIDLGPLPDPVEPENPKPQITPELAGAILIPSPADSVANANPKPATPVVRPDPALAAQVDSALIALCEIADVYQVTVAVNSSLAGFSAIQRAINSARCPWLAVNLDPVAMLHDWWSIDEIFSRLGTSLAHVLARDAIRGDAGRIKPMPVGTGNVPWNELLGALDALDYRGWITIDPSGLSDPTRALRAGLERFSPPIR